jgi:acyl-CoA hydrolase
VLVAHPGLSGGGYILAAGVHLVVTEYGAADLRSADEGERRRRLIAVAAPEFRDRLAV